MFLYAHNTCTMLNPIRKTIIKRSIACKCSLAFVAVAYCRRSEVPSSVVLQPNWPTRVITEKNRRRNKKTYFKMFRLVLTALLLQLVKSDSLPADLQQPPGKTLEFKISILVTTLLQFCKCLLREFCNTSCHIELTINFNAVFRSHWNGHWLRPIKFHGLNGKSLGQPA